jgi:hypothetical protein
MHSLKPTTLGTGLEGFGYKIRRDEDGTARTTVEVRCIDGRAEIVFVCHVADRIMYEHAVKLASEAQSKSPHVSFVVLALGINHHDATSWNDDVSRMALCRVRYRGQFIA